MFRLANQEGNDYPEQMTSVCIIVCIQKIPNAEVKTEWV